MKHIRGSWLGTEKKFTGSQDGHRDKVHLDSAIGTFPRFAEHFSENKMVTKLKTHLRNASDV